MKVTVYDVDKPDRKLDGEYTIDTTFGAPAVGDEELWSLVRKITPRRSTKEWNWAVLDLAATVCLPKVPRFSTCPLQADCALSRARS